MSYISILFCALLFHTTVNCLQWYENQVLYQIYPKSFQDSNGDGIGDIKGIISRAQYFKDIGIGAVWLSPIYPSPMKDNGYDVANYTGVADFYGTLDDVKNLIKKLHDLGVKILLDLVPNHTSDEHPWFKDSVNKKNGKDDYYIWIDATAMDPSGEWMPPNNWKSLFGGRAWTYNDTRKQFYLHQFGSYQPDLNYRNPKVIDEMKNVMRFWLDLGVDGFRVDAVPYLVEKEDLTDESLLPNCNEEIYDCLVHNKTKDQPETYEVLKELGTVFNEDKYKSKPRIMFLEAYTTIENTMKYFSEHAAPFNFQLVQLQRDMDADQIAKLINDWNKALPQNKTCTWVMGNHDNPRIGTKLGEDMIDAANMLLFMAPGSSGSYYGEELGMVNTDLSKEGHDERDPERTPMQWDNTTNAGFTSGKPWLPVNPNFWEVNKAKEISDKKSHLTIYKDLIKLQSEIIDEKNNYTTHVISKWIFGLSRKQHLLLINLNNKDESLNLTSISSIPSSLTVKISSLNSKMNAGDKINKASISMRPRSGVILQMSSAATNTISVLLLVGILLHNFLL